MNRQGFALVELVVLINVVAVCGALAVATPAPNPTAANEKHAITVLRDLARKQRLFKTTAFMDEDQDGRGEFGSLGELSGLIYLVRNGVGVLAPLNPPLLPTWFQTINLAGQASASGYMFMLYLPDAGVPSSGLADVAGGGPDSNIDPDNCEQLWSAYAWPVVAGTTGNRAFFVNQSGMLTQTNMTVIQYSGANLAPAYPNALLAASMTSPLALAPAVGVDGNSWTLVP